MPPSKKIAMPAKLGDPLLVLFRHGRIALASTGAPRIFYDMEHFKYTTRRFNGSYLPTDELVKYVQERRGKWEIHPDEYGICASEFVCSSCKESFASSELSDEEFLQMMKFCPHCGAAMRGVKDV